MLTAFGVISCHMGKIYEVRLVYPEKMSGVKYARIMAQWL
jgi:hypothetical protein